VADAALEGRPSLVAGDVKAALLEALAPVWAATLAGLSAQPDLAHPEEVLFVVQLVPERLQVIRESPSVEQPAVLLVSATFGAVCADDGSALRDALAAYVAGVLSAHVREAADRALRYARAVRGVGGLLLAVRPANGETRLFLARPGADLGSALDLGGIGWQVTAH